MMTLTLTMTWTSDSLLHEDSNMINSIRFVFSLAQSCSNKITINQFCVLSYSHCYGM
jgi:hypothetical protein